MSNSNPGCHTSASSSHPLEQTMKPMNTMRAITLLLGLAVGSTLAQGATETTAQPDPQPVQIQQIRNATAKINYAGKTFLLDPLLAKKGEYPGFPGTFHSELRNPLVDLPMPVTEVMKVITIATINTVDTRSTALVDHHTHSANANTNTVAAIFALAEPKPKCATKGSNMLPPTKI